MTITIYHNPRCSKSRQTLQLLEENNIQPEIVKYLETPPTVEEITALLAKLNKSPREAMRTKETLYKELSLGDDSVTDEQLINAMHSNPKLIERPIVVNGDKARFGRPPEQVLEIL